MDRIKRAFLVASAVVAAIVYVCTEETWVPNAANVAREASSKAPDVTRSRLVSEETTSLVSTGIPRILHQFWVGGRPRPAKIMDRCRDLHPNWTYMLWNDSNLPQLRNKGVYACEPLNGKSDILRYEILAAFGGFYVDADVYCARSFDDLRGNSFVVGYQHYLNPALKGTFRYANKFVGSSVIGSVPGHAVLEKAIAQIGNDASLCKQAAWKAVGPALLTQVLKEHPSIEPLPFSTFFPYHYVQHIDASLSKVVAYGSHAANLWGTTLKWKLPDIPVPPAPKALVATPEVCAAFRTLWTPSLWRASVAMLQYIHSTFAKHKVPYAIAFGTALGYERFGAFLPWDDDIDIVVPSNQMKRAQNTIKGPYCTVLFWGGFKVFKCDSPHAGKYSWRYPFVDVFIPSMKRKSASAIVTNIIFPSVPARFARTTLNVPRNLSAHLRIKYNDPATCKAPIWNHSHEISTRYGKKELPCSIILKECTSLTNDYLPLLALG